MRPQTPRFLCLLKIIPLALLLGAVLVTHTHAQNPFWFIPDYHLDVSHPNPVPDTFPQRFTKHPAGAFNAITDSCGTLMLYTANGMVYDGSHRLLGPLPGFISSENFEIPIVQVPRSPYVSGKGGEYVILYARFTQNPLIGKAVSPAFCVYDARTGVLSPPRFIFEERNFGGQWLPHRAFYSIRFAVSKITGTLAEERIVFMVAESELPPPFPPGFEVFYTAISPLNQNGLVQVLQNPAPGYRLGKHIPYLSQSGYSQPSLGHERTSLELELSSQPVPGSSHNYHYLCWGERGVNAGSYAGLHFLDVSDPTRFIHTGHTFPGVWETIYGLEFDATGTHLAISGKLAPPLHGYPQGVIITSPIKDLLAGTSQGMFVLPGSGPYAHSMIELATNGLLYARAPEHLLAFSISQGNPPQAQALPARNISLPNPAYPGGIFGCPVFWYALPDQVDGGQYRSPSCMEAGSIPQSTDLSILPQNSH